MLAEGERGLQSSQSNRLNKHLLVYIRIKTNKIETAGDIAAAVMTIHAMESGFWKFGVTPGGGGHAPTTSTSLEFIVVDSTETLDDGLRRALAFLLI